MKVNLLFIVLLCAGCVGPFAQDKGFRVTGGTQAERAMVQGAFNTMVPELKRRGFPNVKLPSGEYKIVPHEPTEVWRFPDGGEAGLYVDKYFRRVHAYASASAMNFARPLHPWTANHEVSHPLLSAGGYGAESIAHDKRAFDDRGFSPRGSRRIR